MISRRIARTAFIAFPAILAVGCGIPKVTPTSARPVDQTKDAIRFALSLELRNSGTKEIPLERYSYQFSIDGLGTYNGEWAALRVLPPHSSVQIEIPAVIAIAEGDQPRVAEDGTVEWAVSGDVLYQAPGILGQIFFDAGMRRVSTGFSGSGTLQVPESVQPSQPAQDT